MDGDDFAAPFRKVKDEIHATQERLALATEDDVDVGDSHRLHGPFVLELRYVVANKQLRDETGPSKGHFPGWAEVQRRHGVWNRPK